MKKRCKAIIMVLMVSMVNVLAFPFTGYADELTETGNSEIAVDMTNAFAESNGEYEFIEKKIEEENANITGLIDEDVEEILNKNGILDEDIEKCSEKDIKELEDNINEDSLIFSGYYAVNDIKELADTPVQRDEMIELTPEQVDKYIAEEYYGAETDLQETLTEEFEEMAEDNTDENRDNVISAIGELIGLGVNDVSAETIAYGGLNDKQKTMLREILVISELKDGKTMHVWFKFEWTDMPKYRAVDTVYLGWEGAFYDGCDDQYNSKTNVLHTWYEDYITYKGKSVEASTKYGEKRLDEHYNSYKLTAESYCIRENYLCCVIELHADVPYSNKPVTDLEYEDESVAMNFYLKKDFGRKGVRFFPQYVHIKQKSKFNGKNVVGVAVSVISKDSISAAYTLLTGVVETFSIESYSGPYNTRFEHDFK